MRQPILAQLPLGGADTPVEEQATEVLTRLWAEAERAIVIQRPPAPRVRPPALAERTASVRYSYD